MRNDPGLQTQPVLGQEASWLLGGALHCWNEYPQLPSHVGLNEISTPGRKGLS